MYQWESKVTTEPVLEFQGESFTQRIRVKIVEEDDSKINSAIEEMEKEKFYPKFIKSTGQNGKVTIYFIG